MFVSVSVRDMDRAIAFYEDALGATVDYASPAWSSLTIAGIRISLELRKQEPTSVGLHFIVEDLALSCAAVERAGGQIEPAVEARRGVVIAEVLDSEGNALTLRQRPGRKQLGTLPYGVACIAPPHTA
jgi:predicted enzyme related to lactoylglutathione lyase